jgi:phage minor structural protein
LTIFAFDRDEKIIGVLEQGNKGACPYWDAKIKRVLNGERTLTLTVDLNHPTAKNIVEFGYLAVQNKYKQWELFLITELDQDHTTSLTMNITAEASYVELDGVIIQNEFFDRKNVDDVLPQLLLGTRWTAGHMDNTTDVHDLTIKNQSVLSALQAFRDAWGVELNFYITIAGNAISGRFVEAYIQKGAWKGKRFEWTKDLTEVKRVIDAKSLKTALIGVGKDQTTDNPDGTQTTTTMDFSSVTWSTTAGDPLDKPSGQNWLGDPSALAIYGKPLDGSTTKQHFMGVFSDTQADTPELLLQHTYDQLKTLTTPNITYSMKTIDLYRILNVEQESVDLGDTVAVIDRDLGVEVLARVIEQDENLDYPEQDESILGNFFPNFTGDNLSQGGNAFQRLESEVNATGAIDPLWLQTEFGFARDAVRTGKGTVIMNDTDGILIVDDPSNPQKAIKLNGGTLALANSRDLTTGEFNWRTFGTGDGILADLVETGYLKFDRASGGTLTVGGAITGYKDLTQTQQINFVGKANGDGDNSRRIYYSNNATAEGTPSTEVNAGYANVANPNDGLSMFQTITNAQFFTGFRYIRDYQNGNSVNANNYWNEIEAWSGLTNRAQGKVPTISSGTLTNGVNITNGNHADYGYEASGNGVAKYVQVDLGAVYSDIDTLKIFHYYADGRTTHGTKTQISADGVTWTTIFDSAVSGEYAETSAGKTYTPASVPTGTKIQFFFKFVVSDLSNLLSIAFQVNGTAGQPFTLKPWNMNLGHWDDTQTVTFDGSADATITWSATDWSAFVDSVGDVWFSVLSNPLTANTSMTLSLDYVELNPEYFVQTVPTYQDGVFNIIDSEGHTVASITGDNKGFDQLYIGELTGNNAVLKNDKGDLTYYVDPINGSDATGDGSTGAPYKSIMQVINLLPDVNNDKITITIVGTSITWVENIKLYGLMGGGTLNISLGVSNILKGSIDVRNCTNQITIATTVGTTQSTANTSTLRAQIVAQDNANSSAVLNAFCTTYIYLLEVVLNGNNVATYGINDYNSYVRQDYCEAYNCTYGQGVYQYGARADIINCAGSNPHGILVSYSSHVGGSGRGFASNPTGQEKITNNGGYCTATWTYDAGSAKPAYAPVTITTLTANDTQALFGSNWGLSDYLYTGKRPNTTEVPWYSVAFFNTRDFGFLKNADGSNRTIQKVRISVQRYSGYGDNTSRKPKVWYNKQTSASGAMQALQNGVMSDVGFLWGETKWITLPISFGTAFQNGNAKSIVFYNGADEANYCRFEPKMTLEITHA